VTGQRRVREAFGLKVEFAKGDMLWMDSKGDFFVTCGDDCGFDVGLACHPVMLVPWRASEAEAVRLSRAMLV
jgi:hypothetical protein